MNVMRTLSLVGVCFSISGQLVLAQSVPIPSPRPSEPPQKQAVAGSPRAAKTRGYVTFGGGYLTSVNDFVDGGTKRVNAEAARFDTSYAVRGGPSIDAAAGISLWRSLGVRVGVAWASTATEANVQALVPHPFFFDKSRSISGVAAGLTREELALSLHVAGVFPVGARAFATVFAGPIWIQMKQGVVTDFTYTDSYPFDTAAFGSSVTTVDSGSGIGIGGGAGIAYFLTRAVGLAASAQYAQVNVPVGAVGTTRTLESGGLKAGFGLVIRY